MAGNRKDSGVNSGPESAGKASEKPFGWLDRRRWALQILEEQIEQTRQVAEAKTGRGHDKESRLEWTKTLAKLMELYDQQLSAVKVFLHGHTGPGIENQEPGEQENGAVLFERRFRSLFMEPWTVEHLNLTCEDCGSESRDVWQRSLYKKSKSYGWDTEYLWLCSDCYAKREATQPTEEQMDKDEEEEST